MRAGHLRHRPAVPAWRSRSRLLAGCAKRDSITVGAVPDDYRTNHPIVIAEKDEKTRPAGRRRRPRHDRARSATRSQGFLAGYDRSAAPALTIMIAERLGQRCRRRRRPARDFARLAIARRRAGEPHRRSPPIRPARPRSRRRCASPMPRCGRRPTNAAAGPRTCSKRAKTSTTPNFGCSYQNNLAAQIANPADLLGPRKQTDRSTPSNRGAVDRRLPATAHFGRFSAVRKSTTER